MSEKIAMYGVYTSANTVPNEQLVQSIPHPPVSKQKTLSKRVFCLL